jgi:4-aminobutyrate aminotransferase-like enzyme
MQAPGHHFTELMVTLAKRMAGLTNNRLTRSFFVNSGAEANDGAVKLSLKHALQNHRTGFSIVALDHGFHGRTSLPLSLTGMAGRKGFGPYATFPGVVHVAAPYCYRCPFDLTPDTCGARCADEVETALTTRVSGEAAIMIAEPILGVGGVIVPPGSYWPKVEAICRRNKITLIMDEVFTGFGRTGKMFAHQHWNLEPDVVTYAKAIGGGLPLGGILMTEEIGTSISPGEHYTTFGSNNQVSLSAAHAVLDVLQGESLIERAASEGAQFLSKLRSLGELHEAVGDVRGKGMMLGVELVSSRDSKTPAPALAKRVQQTMQSKGFLIALTGNNGNVIRLTPPLVITPGQVDATVAALDETLHEVGS